MPVRGCALVRPADAIFGVPDMHVLNVEIDDQQRLVLTIESGQLEEACPACGLAVGHDRRVRILHDAPCFGRVTILRWLVRMWRCGEPLLSDDNVYVTRFGAAADGADFTSSALGYERA